jgi:hypothetical protein
MTHAHTNKRYDEASTRRKDLYLTKHKTQITMPPVGFDPQTQALDREATGIGQGTEGK